MRLRRLLLQAPLFTLLALIPSVSRGEDTAGKNLFESGNKRLKEGNFADAISYYTGAIQADAQFAKAYTRRGAARRNNGDSAGALQDLNRALELDAKDAEAYYNRGLIAGGRREYSRGLEDLDRAVELDPKNAEIYAGRGLLKTMKGDAPGAVADFSRAIDLDSKNLDNYQARGKARMSTNDLDGAIADFTRILQSAKNPDTYYDRGSAKVAKGDLDGGIADFGQVINADSNDVPARTQRGIAKADKHDFKGALTDLEKALELKPSDNIQLRLWLVRSQQGERARATQELTAYLATRKTGTSSPQEISIARFLVGQATEEELLKLAESSSADAGREFQCRIYFYAGSMRLLEKDKGAAADRFQKSIATGKMDVREYASAAAELKGLGDKR